MIDYLKKSLNTLFFANFKFPHKAGLSYIENAAIKKLLVSSNSVLLRETLPHFLSERAAS